ncbi:MAG TPA: GNAT family N-acetyltransferase [Nitrospira sp.]|nr:GNAT family N-acetyltransferase [Nitrospira sp.]
MVSATGEIVPQQDHVFIIDPLRDPRWDELIEQHPVASVFHSRPWLQALHATYGYEPIAITTTRPSEPLRNALVFCVVQSWLTGGRLVSLPFSDHCEPLVTRPEEFHVLMRFVEALREDRRWKYVQVRSANAALNIGAYLTHTQTYCLQRLDLRPGLEDLYRKLHKDCIQRKIRRAEREDVQCQSGRSTVLLEQLYGLLCITRARYGVPPQPIEWFRNLVACLQSSLCIRVASKGGQPIAAILTLRQGTQMVYKYSAADPTQTHLGGTIMLLWETIKDAKCDGLESLDLGRSDLDNLGLITFKARWAAESSTLTTWEAPAPVMTRRHASLMKRCAKGLFVRLPTGMQVMAGRLLYRHVG